MAEFLWQLRYRSPLSPTRGVDDVVIATDTDSEDDAKKLAQWWLANKVPSPSTRFVYVRRLVVARTKDMLRPLRPTDDVDTGGPSPAQAASRDSAPFQPPARKSGADEPPKAPGVGSTPGRLGA